MLQYSATGFCSPAHARWQPARFTLQMCPWAVPAVGVPHQPPGWATGEEWRGICVLALFPRAGKERPGVNAATGGFGWGKRICSCSSSHGWGHLLLGRAVWMGIQSWDPLGNLILKGNGSLEDLHQSLALNLTLAVSVVVRCMFYRIKVFGRVSWPTGLNGPDKSYLGPCCPWPRAPFQPLGLSVPALVMLQQCWSPALYGPLELGPCPGLSLWWQSKPREEVTALSDGRVMGHWSGGLVDVSVGLRLFISMYWGNWRRLKRVRLELVSHCYLAGLGLKRSYWSVWFLSTLLSWIPTFSMKLCVFPDTIYEYVWNPCDSVTMWGICPREVYPITLFLVPRGLIPFPQ